MKRSEAVMALANRLKDENLTRISANSQEVDLADVLLRFIEREVGMYPPISSRYIDTFLSLNGIMSHPPGYEWDQEDV